MSRAKRKCAFGARADSEGPDQTARKRSLIRAFAVRCQNHCILYKDPDDIAHAQDDVNPHILRILDGIFRLTRSIRSTAEVKQPTGHWSLEKKQTNKETKKQT